MSELDAYETPPGYGDTIGKCLTFVEIEALLAAERERCAAVADQMGQGAGLSTSRMAYWDVALMIRNLPPQADGGQT